MTGQSSARPKNSGKKKISSVANAANLFAQEDNKLALKYQILKENHEILLKEYTFLEERSKVMDGVMNLDLPRVQNPPMEPDARCLAVLKDLETERSEKDELKKVIEGLKNVESDKEAIINELRISKEKEKEDYKKLLAESRSKFEDLSITKEKLEEECKKLEKSFGELTKSFGAVQTECSSLKSLYYAEEAIGQGGNRNVSNIVEEPIVIFSDESEDDNPLKKRNITRQRSIDKKEEEAECSNRTNLPNLNHLPSSSSSSSSSDDEVLVHRPVKRSREG